jgi:hypothetical protein
LFAAPQRVGGGDVAIGDVMPGVDIAIVVAGVELCTNHTQSVSKVEKLNLKKTLHLLLSLPLSVWLSFSWS